MSSKTWRNSQDKAFEVWLVYSLLATFLILAVVYPILLWQRIAVLIITNVIIFFISLIIKRRNLATIEKIFFIPTYKSLQIIKNVLNAKQLPFSTQRKNQSIHYCIENEEVEIILQPHRVSRKGLVTSAEDVASKIKIRPTNIENQPLIQSLKQKLDEGFSPKGA
jgi:hypothetical protein